MVRRGAIGLALVLLAAACSSGGVDEADLSSIILQEAEAPEGTTFLPDRSGPVSLDDLTNDDDQAAALSNDGFLSGYDTFFASPGLAGIEGDISRSKARLIDSSVFLFETREGAQASFTRLRDSAEETFESLGSLTDLTIEGLGSDAFAIKVDFRNTAAGPDVGILHSWRVDNVILRLVIWGETVDENEVRDLAGIVDERANN